MTAPEKSSAEKDPYWWTPWAVLIGLVVYGLLGFLGVLSPKQKGPTAADVPATTATQEPAPSASKKK
jgi:hypothetical protein